MFDVDAATGILRRELAPWVQDLDLAVAAIGAEIAAEARVLRLGKTLAFGEIAITDAGALVAHATATYAILGAVAAAS